MPNQSAAVTQGERISAVLKTARAYLRTCGVTSESDSAYRDAEILLAHVVGRDSTWLVAHADDRLDHTAQRRFESLTEQRASGMPIAYILGTAWFYGRPFKVTPSVLIPRPETEHLIDETLAFLRRWDYQRDDVHQRKNAPVVLDVGTGSGAIAITLAVEFPGATVYATDVSWEALAIARHNASSHCSAHNVHLEQADLLPLDPTQRFDVVIANLPYIPTAHLPRPPDPTSFEPREALDGGTDGLAQYRRLLEQLPSRVSEAALLLLEAAPPAIAALHDLATVTFANAVVTVGKDYAGLDRFITILLP